MTDYGTQLWAGIDYYHSVNSGHFSLSYLGSYVHYHEHESENKWINTINLNYIYQLWGRLYGKTGSHGFVKLWQHLDRGYFDITGQQTIGFKGTRYTPQFIFTYRKTQFRYFDFSNHRQLNLQFDQQFKVSPQLTINMQTTYQNSYFPRSIQYFPELSQYETQPRRDETIRLQLGGEYSAKIILGSHLEWQRNHSDYAYLEHQALRLRSYASWRIARLTMHTILLLQYKRYDQDPDQITLPYFPDPEQNRQNQLYVGLEYPLLQQLSLTTKTAYMRNETAYVGQYFDKWLIGIGLKYRGK